MTDENVPQVGGGFEGLKKVNDYGAEYWSARELQPLLGYSQWRRFENAIKKAVTSCEQSGNDPSHHFASAGKPIPGGKGAVQVVPDFHLSRFACYLIAQNGDPRKPEIANAQKYFAIQTRRQELSDQAAADLERLELRKQTSEEFKALSGAAREAGVQNRMFGIFHDAGYKGLYGGLGADAIKARKRIPEKEQLMDRMDSTELAANQFRMTQTRDKRDCADFCVILKWHGHLGRVSSRAGSPCHKIPHRPATSWPAKRSTIRSKLFRPTSRSDRRCGKRSNGSGARSPRTCLPPSTLGIWKNETFASLLGHVGPLPA